MSTDTDHGALRRNTFARIPDPRLRERFNTMAETERKGERSHALLFRFWKWMKDLFIPKVRRPPQHLEWCRRCERFIDGITYGCTCLDKNGWPECFKTKNS